MSSSNNSPLGCLIVPVIAGLVLYFMFRGDNRFEEKIKAENAAKYKRLESKFHYNIDSLGKTINMYFDHDPRNIHGKCVVLEKDGDSYSLCPNLLDQEDGAVIGYRLPPDLIAYNESELSTIIIKDENTVTSSSWSGPRVEKEQVKLQFYDVQSRKFLLDTLMVPDGTPYVHKSRRTTVETYSFSNPQIVGVITRKLLQQE